MISHPAWIEVDLDQFRKNIAAVRKHIGPSLFCLPVKANAYGHGLVEIGKAAQVDYLGVAHLKEGVELRQAGVQTPILVLGAIHEDQIPDLIRWNLEFTVSSRFKADLVAQKCGGKKCRVHLEVDTGMQRTGVRPTTAVDLYRFLQASPCFEVVGIYSHLASDGVAQQQIDAFKALLPGEKLIRHISNSAGIASFPHAHMDMVRPGIIPYGYLAPPSMPDIGPCFTVKTKVCYFKVVEAGAGISYNHTWKAPKQTRIVTIPVGYGDGYRRCLSNRASVLIRGRRFPIVGNICMDQFMVDIGSAEVFVGDEVVLIGRQGNEEISLMEIAQLCDTIPYEVLCLFNDRIPRVYRSAPAAAGA